MCGLVFASRNQLLKHIEKTGHVVDPTRKTGHITGLYYIPPDESGGKAKRRGKKGRDEDDDSD